MEDNNYPDPTDLSHSAWGGHFDVTYGNTYILSSNKKWLIEVWDDDGAGDDLLFRGELTVKPATTGLRHYSDVYAQEYQSYISPYGYVTLGYGTVNSYLSFWYIAGPLKNPSTFKYSNSLLLDISLNYHN